METFVAGKKYQRTLLTTCAREPMPEKSWNRTKPGLERVLSWRSTESLADLRPAEWQTILAKLRRARLLAAEDPYNPGHLDTHPLVREYFGEQLRGQRIDGWKECSRRLYNYYRTLASDLPDTFREMEPLFLAAIYGCIAGLYRETLHEVYIPRIQRGDASFAANVLGARGALLSVLVHFFESLRWDSSVETGRERAKPHRR